MSLTGLCFEERRSFLHLLQTPTHYNITVMCHTVTIETTLRFVRFIPLQLWTVMDIKLMSPKIN